MKNDELLNKIKKLEEENYSLKEKLSILEQASSIKPQTDESIKITEEFFNSEDFGVQVFDKNGFSIKMNLKQQEILGLSSNDIGIGTFNVLTDPYSIMNGASELYKKAYSGEIISHTFEYNLNISENSWDTKKEKIILLETIIPIPGKSSKVENVVSILFDITDKSLLESLINNTKSKYESLVENIPAIIYMFSLNKGGVFYSSQVKNILGYSKEHLYANPMLWNQSIHPDDKPLISKAFEDFQKGLGFNVQYRIKNSKGDWLWFEDRLINSLDKSGEQIIEGVAIDITERKKAEELLKRSESISTSIIKSLNEGIIIRDKSNKIILHNDAAKSILGSRILKDLDNLNPNLHYKFINESGENYHLDELPAIFTLKTGKPVVDKVLGVKNENLIKWFKVNTIPIFENDETTPSMVVASIDDITDNLTLINNLKKSNSIKNKFFSIIAHDLKNPFHAIINLTELMSLKEFESSKVQEYISLIHNSSRQGYNLLINLLEWARIQTNSIQIKKTNFNLSETINYNIELLSSNSEEKNLKIEISCPENIPMIFADKNILSTVIRNLLSNGIKFSNKDGFISINSYIKDGMCFISIKDSGIGISNSDQKKLFKLEENFSTPGTGKEKGTGLGLVLCKELIELHGGKISIDSEIGKGTKVSFWIPLKD